jgi:hypothetical protein
MDRIENTASSSCSIVAREFIATGTCLPSCCLATLRGETHRQQGELISLLLFFQNKESRLKIQFGQWSEKFSWHRPKDFFETCVRYLRKIMKECTLLEAEYLEQWLHALSSALSRSTLYNICVTRNALSCYFEVLLLHMFHLNSHSVLLQKTLKTVIQWSIFWTLSMS